MKISIVIPVYNEGEHLSACLQAIAEQSVAPYEVIVVDNNSTDDSVAVAESFDFVKIIRERRQGVVYARGRGFDAAKGDVIGRIDADTMIHPSWVETVVHLFSAAPVDALSGAVSYHDLPWKRTLAKIDLTFRQWIANGMDQDVFLYGSNMAIRKVSWQRVRTLVCKRAGLHEDFDLAIHLEASGARVVFDSRLKAAVSLRRLNVPFMDYLHYVWLSPKTYRSHGLRRQQRMYSVIALVVPGYIAFRLLYRAYDPATDSLSISNLLLERGGLRVNPATFVD